MLTFTLSTESKDVKFSYKLHKNPNAAVDFERTSGKRQLKGFYINNQEYFGLVSFGTLDEVVNLEEHQTWNIKELSTHTLYSITSVFNTILRSAVRGDTNSDLSQEDVDTPFTYVMKITPLSLYDTRKLELICFMLGLKTNVISNGIGIEFYATMPLYKFLQAVNIALFVHLRTRYDKVVGEQIAVLGKYINDFSDLDEHAKKTIADMVAGKNYKLQAAMNVELDFAVEDIERHYSLHDWKHDRIVELIDKYYNDFKVTELGCGSGQFAMKLRGAESKYNYVGYDVESNNVERSRKRVKNKRFTFEQKDILLLDEEMELCLLLEVVEHLDEADREYIAKLINYVYKPAVLIVSTPNRSANMLLYNMEEGALRHTDHKIEFDEIQYSDYCAKFTNYYVNHTTIDTSQKDNTVVSPSFVTVFTRHPNTVSVDIEFVKRHKAKVAHKFADEAMKIAPFRLIDVNYVVTTKQLRGGMEERSYLKNADGIFYLGSSIAPADYKETGQLIGGQIEHPEYIQEYYTKRGYTGELTAQIKYMGSRATIWVARNYEIAKRYNMPLVSVRSRNGYEFFSPEDMEKYHTEIYNAAYGKETVYYDFVVLDAEITPWSYKAKGLIQCEFYEPVAAQLAGINSYNHAIVHNDMPNEIIRPTVDVSNHYRFLTTLAQYAKVDEEVKIHIFNALAVGYHIGTRSEKIVYGHSSERITHDYIAKEVCGYSSLLRSVETVYGFDAIMDLWHTIDNGNSTEGLVIKPNFPVSYNGTLLQSAMKVRTMSYLQLIYGPNFKDYMPRILQRNVGKKRRRSILEQSIGNGILQSFCERDDFNRKKYIAAFFAMNGIKTDATL